MDVNGLKFFAAKSGYSLIELVLVIVFLAITLTVLLNVFSQGLIHGADSEIMTVAVFLAQAKMEEILADKEGRGYIYVVNSNYPVESNPEKQQGFTRSVAITDVSTYKLIKVKVSHSSIPDVELTTIVANY